MVVDYCQQFEIESRSVFDNRSRAEVTADFDEASVRRSQNRMLRSKGTTTESAKLQRVDDGRLFRVESLPETETCAPTEKSIEQSVRDGATVRSSGRQGSFPRKTGRLETL